jgi:Mannosylglycerate hydrolase MGH1-like glycoside hydrolase domain
MALSAGASAEASIPAAQAWNSWDSVHPAEFVHLPSGVRLAFAAYSAKANRFTRFPPGPAVRLGPRTIGLETAALTLAHAGTEIALQLALDGEDRLVGRWWARRFGEWGLRFWLLLVLRWEPPAGGGAAIWRFDGRAAELTAEACGRSAVCRTAPMPLMATFHEDWAALQGEFEREGYFYLGSRGVEGRFAALRFNLEENPAGRFDIAVAPADAPVLSRPTSVLVEPAPGNPVREAPQDALEAVRDVIAWNTVWDSANRRRYTALSRHWVAQKFGGWGVWLDDLFYHALMAAPFDLDLARDNLRAVLAGRQPAGNLPCLLTGNDAWVDRSQPPICAFVVWLLYLRSGGRDLLELAYKPLLANHDWWWRTRDGNGDGLLEFGSSPVGGGLYRGTKLAAKDESSMDNSPTHDETTFHLESGTLDCADVGLNSLIALDGEMLALIARAIGDGATARRLELRTEALRQRIADRLWDPDRQVFANRLWSGRFVRSLAPTSFYPLLAGAARPDQAAAMVRLLADPRKFGGHWLLPSVARDDPAFADNVYWRGRIWPPLNFLVWHALRRAHYDAAAGELADNGYRLFMGEWRHHRRCPENYNAVSGAAMDQPDTDPFYGWGALLPYLAVAATVDVNPWGGWEIRHRGEDMAVGPMLLPAGRVRLESRDGVLRIGIDGRPCVETNLLGRLVEIELAPDRFAVTLPAIALEGAWLEFADRSPLSATLDGRSLALAGGRLPLHPSRATQRLDVRFA